MSKIKLLVRNPGVVVNDEMYTVYYEGESEIPSTGEKTYAQYVLEDGRYKTSEEACARIVKERKGKRFK